MASMGGEEQEPKESSDKVEARPPLRAYEEYRRLLEAYIKTKDPEATLPEVESEFHFENDVAANVRFTGKDELWTGGGNVYIGNASLTLNQEEKTAFCKFITLYDTWREDTRKFGYATYLALIKQLVQRDLRLTAGHSLSRASHALWKGLVAAGIAHVVGEEIVNENATDSNYSTTKFELV